MQPNPNVYGTSSQWYDQHFSQNVPSVYKNKKPDFGGTNSRLDTAIANNRVVGGQPLDKTISYCGLGTESDLSHSVSVYLSNNALTEIRTDRDITDFFVWEKSEVYDFYANRGKLYNARKSAWSDNMSSDNVHNYINPICSIKPQNQVLEVRVQAYNVNRTQVINVDLDSYCATRYVDYPLIRSVFVVCYYGANQNRDNGSLGTSVPAMRYMEIAFNVGLLSPYKYIDNSDMYNFALSSYDRRNIAILSGAATIDTLFVDNESACVYYGKPGIYTILNNNNGILDVYRDISNDNIDDIKEYYLKQAACLGLYFTPKHTVAVGGAFTDPDMYVGILDTNGAGHGNYLRGVDTVNAPQNNLTDMYDIEYNPTKADNTHYINDTQFYYQLPAKSAIKYYVMTGNQLSALFAKLYSATIDNVQQGESIESHNLKTVLTVNGIDCITSLIKFPCEVFHAASPVSIKLGTYDSGIRAYPLLFTTDYFSFSFNLSKDNGLYPVYGDFRDNEPLTKAELTIPFCGTVQIPTTYLYQYDDLNIDLIIDYITGACTAVIMCNGIAIDSISGSCGIQLPVTGIQANNIDSAINALALQDNKRMTSLGVAMIGGALAIGTAIFTGGAAAIAAAAIGATTGIAGTAINAAQQGKQIDYELSHMDLPIKTVGGASAQIGQSMDMRCKLRITRPVMADSYNAEVYANTIGFACISNGKVSDYSGLTIGNIELDGVNCTAAEKDLIKTAFANGVYL